MQHNDYKNILVITLRKIGDTIIATAGLNLLRQYYPNAHISVLVKPLTQSIVQNHPCVDEVLLYDYSHKVNLSTINQTINLLKSKHFDLCIILDNKVRSAMLAYLSGIPTRVGFEKIEFRNCYLHLFYNKLFPIDYDVNQVQQAKNHEIFINRFTGGTLKASMVLPLLPDSSKQYIDQLFQDTLTTQNRSNLKIALCLRSGQKKKDWSLSNFQTTVEQLAQSYPTTFYIIGSKADIPFAEEFIHNTKAHILNFCGQTTLPELGYLFSKFDFFLTVDTGSAHICGATKTPMVVVFGATSASKWAPYSKHAVCIESGISCVPCAEKKCNTQKCLHSISPKTVYDACCKVLDNIATNRLPLL